jgi:hypothetical protein
VRGDLAGDRRDAVADEKASDLARELAAARDRVQVAEQLVASEVDRRQRVDAALVESRVRDAQALEVAAAAASAAAVVEGRVAALAEERDALRVELAEVRHAAERDRREARERLESLVRRGA